MDIDDVGNTALPSTSQKLFTRTLTACPVFGQPSDLQTNVLPTYADVIRCCLWIRYEQKLTKKEPLFKEISESVALKIQNIWKTASIPVISHQRIVQLIRIYHDKYNDLSKVPKKRQSQGAFKNKVSNFRKEAESKLFDIAACKCNFTSRCNCDKDRKIPLEEKTFLRDQRTVRKMVIGSVDTQTTRALEEKKRRKRKAENFACRCNEAQSFDVADNADAEDHDNDNMSSISSDVDAVAESCDTGYVSQRPQPSTSRGAESTKQMRIRLSTFATTADRYGVPDRVAASLASAMLEDIGIVRSDDVSNVVDRSKVRREKKKSRAQNTSNLAALQLLGLYFDGRKDATLVQMKKDDTGTYYRKTVIEEHLTLVQEPENEYLGHVTPANGRAIGMKNSILDFVTGNDIDVSHLIAVGCDGTVVNTGSKGGIIRLLEEELGRPLHWFICLLHGNELPLRHLFYYLDGATTGPRGFCGTIGKQLETCHHLPLFSFAPVKGNLPKLSNDITKDLSSDQKFLYEICEAVDSGNCSLRLCRKDPGKLSHSRWVTMANRLLRLYVGTENPSEKLSCIVAFIMKVYAPMWFIIKCKPSSQDGAKHLCQTIFFARYLPAELKSVVHATIQRNAYYANPENMLLAMISDERQHIKELGIRRVIKARKKAVTAQLGVREFIIPSLNFDAEDYIDLISWKECNVTEPPITAGLSESELWKFATESCNVQKFPCHTQCVERNVKLVTEASKSVIGAEAREGFIRNKIYSRNIMPTFDTKGQYKPTPTDPQPTPTPQPDRRCN